MTTNTTGFWRSQDNRSILKITQTPNQQSQGSKAKQRTPLNKETKRSSSRNARRTGRCSVSRSSMALPPDKSPRPNESLIRMDTAEILKQLDGPTASFLLPCSSKTKMEPVMEPMAEVLLNARSRRATVGPLQAMPLEPQVEAINQSRSRKLPQ